MRARDILNTAASLVSGDRNLQHGNIRENFEAIADLWTAIIKASGNGLDTPLDGHDVANMMEALKIARRYYGAYNDDDYVDGAGYAAIAGQLKSEK